jgi:hypothetical protein
MPPGPEPAAKLTEIDPRRLSGLDCVELLARSTVPWPGPAATLFNGLYEFYRRELLLGREPA